MCIFCKIVAKEIPSHVLYEDDGYLAILDISQVTQGHTLILPKTHYDDFRVAPDDVLGKCASIAKQLSFQLEKAYAPLGYNLLSNCGEAAGQSVHHLHFHLIPRYDETDGLVLKFNAADHPDLKKIADEINQKK